MNGIWMRAEGMGVGADGNGLRVAMEVKGCR